MNNAGYSGNLHRGHQPHSLLTRHLGEGVAHFQETQRRNQDTWINSIISHLISTDYSLRERRHSIHSIQDGRWPTIEEHDSEVEEVEEEIPVHSDHETGKNITIKLFQKKISFLERKERYKKSLTFVSC